MSERIRNCELPTDGIHFHIERVRSRTKNENESAMAQSYLDMVQKNKLVEK